MLGAFYISNAKLITHLNINTELRYLSLTPANFTFSFLLNWVECYSYVSFIQRGQWVLKHDDLSIDNIHYRYLMCVEDPVRFY